MSGNRGLVIVVLSCHPLLGEGVGRLLGEEPDVVVRQAGCHQAGLIDELLAAGPDVVVVERCSQLDATAILERAPDALVFDISIEPGPTWVYRRQEIPGDPIAILELVQLLRSGHPVIPLGARHPTMPVHAGS
jgi:DNA-binding NarL/FixJ family response regulator